MAVLAYASASSSCIEVCSPTSVFHVRSFAAPVSAATTTSAAICQPIPTPYGASSPRQADRLPRVIRATFPAYTRRIYVLTFRMVSGFESCGPLAQVSPPLFASCTSGRRFAYSFLQIPPRDGHPCCSASSSHHQGLQRTCTAKSTKWPPQPIRSRLRATRHAWRTTKWRSAAEADPRIDSCFKPLSWPLAVGFLLASVPAWLSPLRRTPA
jgi:hypothetical protein